LEEIFRERDLEREKERETDTYMIPGGEGGGGCLAYTPHLKKSLAYTPRPHLKKIIGPKMGKFGQKCHFLEMF
jgi:hypothetical protein